MNKSFSLKLEDISFSYSRKKACTPALDSVSFAFSDKKFISILGANGSGKSTLMKVLLGLLRPSKGEITVDGGSLFSMARDERARRFAYVPQFLAFEGGIDVLEFLLSARLPYLGFGRSIADEDLELVNRVAVKTGCAHFLGRTLDSLSGGERQKVYLARALVQGGEVLLLDEPVSHLDLKNQLEVMSLLQTLSSSGKTVITIIHDINMARQYSDHVIMLKKGRVVAAGPPQDVITPDSVEHCFDITVKAQGDYLYPLPLELSK